MQSYRLRHIMLFMFQIISRNRDMQRSVYLLVCVHNFLIFTLIFMSMVNLFLKLTSMVNISLRSHSEWSKRIRIYTFELDLVIFLLYFRMQTSSSAINVIVFRVDLLTAHISLKLDLYTSGFQTFSTQFEHAARWAKMCDMRN